MAVAFDAVSANQNFGGASGLSWTHTNVGTANLYVRVTVPWTSAPSRPTVDALTYDGVSMLANLVGNVQSATFQASLPGDASIWELPNPNTGAKTVALTWSAANAYGGGAGSITYTGVDQSVPCSGTAVTANGTSTTPSVTVTSTTAGNMVGDCLASEGGSGSYTAPTAADTGRLSGIGTSGTQSGGAEDAAAGGSVTLNWTLNETRQWIQVAAEIMAAAAAGAAGPLVGGSLTKGVLVRGGRLVA